MFQEREEENRVLKTLQQQQQQQQVLSRHFLSERILKLITN
jgi:hypothetical protein